MSSLFRCVGGITAKSIAAVTKRHGGETEELMRWGARVLWLEFHPQLPV
jgi:hypothetical protein